MNLKNHFVYRWGIILALSYLVVGMYSHSLVLGAYGQINMPSPVSSPVNAGYLYGEKLYSSSTYGHMGLDFSAASGTNVYSTYAGTVIAKKNLTYSYGNYIIIESNHPSYPGTKFYHLYAHLSDNSQVWVGKAVNQGELIGLSGSSGNATGPHLHYEIRMSSNNYYNQRNPEGLLARSTLNNYGGVYGEVRTANGNWARAIRVSGATKPDLNYGASYTYYVMDNGSAFPDENAYGINYYIARANTGSITLNYNNGARTQPVTIYANTDYKVNNIYLP